MTSCNEFTRPPVFTGSCLLFKMSFSCRSSPRAFYRFSPRAQSCSEYTMVWQDTSECLFKHLMRVKRIIRIRWWRSIKKNLILFTVIYYICSRFPDSRTQYFPTHGQAPRRLPSPSAFSSGTAVSETVESRRGKQQKELYQDRNMSTNEQKVYVFHHTCPLGRVKSDSAGGRACW